MLNGEYYAELVSTEVSTLPKQEWTESLYIEAC